MATKKRSMNELRQVKEFKLKDQYDGKCRSGGLQNDTKRVEPSTSPWIKSIRILEVPLLLLVMAFGCIEEKAIITAIILIAISIVRLAVNVITDSAIYKR